METNLRKWWINDLYIRTVTYILLTCLVWFVNGDIQNSTHVTLCAAQCEALCLDGVADCEKKCGGARQWITTCDADCELDCNRASPLNNNICDKSTCRSTCSALSQYTQTDKCHVLHPPNVTIVTIDPSTIELSWSRPSELIPSSMSPLTAIYIVEETHNHPQWTAVTSTAFKPWSTGTRFRVNITDVCNLDQYRVIAINRFGSTGFSSPARLPGLKPGDIRNIRYAGSGVYYYKNQDYPDQSQFMAILQWDIPAGWKASDIDHYEWNPMVRRHCSDTNKDSLPVFTSMKNRKNHILMTMASSSYDCTFKAEVRAVSRCNMYGDWTQFNVDLTNCSSIIGYRCAAESVISPDNVQNVNLSISATNVEQLAEIFTNKTLLLSNHIHSPLLINLHINWRPPVYKGSLGVIHHYMIRSGTVKMNLFPLPPIFNEPVKTINVSNDIVQLTFELHTDNIPYIFGVQVIAVGPGQVIEENDWGLFKIYTIEVSRNNTGIAQLKQEGKVLLDESGIVIVYINNSIPVYFLFDSPSARMDNNTIDRYAVQWGPLVGPHDKMQIENNTILPVNKSVLSVYLLHTEKSYGIKVRYLSEDELDPDNDNWEDTPMIEFSLPSDGDQDALNNGINLKIILPVCIGAGILICIVVITGTMKWLRSHKNFKNLEERLAITEEIDENGDHYFVMRPSNTGNTNGEEFVVADRWELPHSCLKMGRTLGSGAFGQVVKGRVSKTLLRHRGIDSQSISQRPGMHVTVAIKMLQDGAEEKQIESFLQEIDMMKSIAYHRNIVSILGCCTLREPYCLIVEHMANGDLLSYFKRIRSAISQREEYGDGYINQDIELFTPQDLLSVARQVATGMEYLSQKGFVHRDLAARNILVGENKSVKIGDFGLTRYIYYDLNKIYVNRGGGRLPLRWMAPEAVFDLTYSSASDVWSYGILLYEIVTLGASPYPELSNTELLQSLKNGYRMKKPDNCTQDIYDIMMNCWQEVPEQRPTFTNLCQTFTTMLEEDAHLEYFHFNMPMDHDYYRINSDDLESDLVNDVICSGEIGINSDKSIESKHELVKQEVVTEIPDDNCSITELSKAEIQVEEPTYTDKAFRTIRVSVSSIDNSLYSVMDNTTSISINDGIEEKDGNIGDVHPDNDIDTELRVSLASRMHKISGLSDEVFFHCDSCSTLSNDDEHDASICSKCNTLNFTISPFDIHVSERTDSAICSTASYESDQSASIQSESSSATSDEYLMPESPLAVTMSSSGDASKNISCKLKQAFDFAEVDATGQIIEAKSVTAHNPCYTDISWLPARDDETSRILRQQLYADSVLESQTSSNSEKWCVANTKL